MHEDIGEENLLKKLELVFTSLRRHDLAHSIKTSRKCVKKRRKEEAQKEAERKRREEKEEDLRRCVEIELYDVIMTSSWRYRNVTTNVFWKSLQLFSSNYWVIHFIFIRTIWIAIESLQPANRGLNWMLLHHQLSCKLPFLIGQRKWIHVPILNIIFIKMMLVIRNMYIHN